MPLNQVQVNAPSATSYPDGSTPGQLGGKQGDAIVSELHGKYYTQASRGNVYYASNAAVGAAFSIYNGTSYIGLMLSNPPGSGKLLSMIRVNLGLNTQASTAMATWGYCWTTPTAGLIIGTPISALGLVTATRGSAICGLGGQGASVAGVATTATFSAAGVFGWSGRNAAFTPTNAAITVGMATNATEDFDGTMIIPPGMIWTLTSNILSGWTACATYFWEEVPLP